MTRRIARAGFGLAQAEWGNAASACGTGRWSAATPRAASQTLQPAVTPPALWAASLELDLVFGTQPLLLQGQQGLSRKGEPDAEQASYYSQPSSPSAAPVASGQ